MKKFLKTHGLFLILLLGYIVVYLFYLGHRPLSVPDEGRYPEVAREMLKYGQWITPKVNGVPFLDKPPLYYWFEACSMGLLGVTRWAIRLPIVLFALMGLIITYFTGFVLYNRRTALYSTLCLGSSVLYFGAAHYANLDLEVAVWVYLALCCFLLSQNPNTSHRRFYLILAYLSAALGFLTKGLIAMVFPAMIIGLWVAIFGKWKTLKNMMLLPGVLLFFIIISPWLYLVHTQNPDFFHYFFYYQQIHRFLGHNFNNNMPFWFYLPILLAATFPMWLYGISTIKNKFISPMQSVTGFWVIAVVSIVIFFSIPQAKIVGYILPALPPLCLLLGRAIALTCDAPAFRNKVICVATLILVVVAAYALFYLRSNLFETMMTSGIPLGMLYLFISLLILWGILLSVSLSTNTPNPAFIISALCLMTLMMMIAFAVKNLQINSSIDIANYLKPKLTPDTIIIENNLYQYDLPVYLKRILYVSYAWNNPNIKHMDNWVSDFVHGLNGHRQRYPWMILPQQIQPLWHKHHQVVIISENQAATQLAKQLKGGYLKIIHGYTLIIKGI